VLIDYRAAEHSDPRVLALSPRYVISPEPLDAADFTLVRDGPLRIYESKHAAPRAFVGQLKTAPDGSGESSLQPGEREGAVIETYAPNDVRIVTMGPWAFEGDLVLTDTWYPGWRVFAAGERRPIVRVNSLMRGVLAVAPRTMVHMVYEPQSFRLGLYLSLVGVAVVFAAIGFRLSRRRR
jgi:hypothetical protein